MAEDLSSGEPGELHSDGHSEHADLGKEEPAHDAGEHDRARARAEAYGSDIPHERLAEARAVLKHIETEGEASVEGAPAGREQAMKNVKTAQLHVDNVVRLSGLDYDSQQAHRNSSPEAAPSEVLPTPGYIGEVVLPKGMLGMADNSTAKYRPAANELVGQMLEDPDFAQGVLEGRRIGTDYTDEGISDVMAAYAYPYLKRAEKAEAEGKAKRAELYRQEASARANGIARVMKFERLASSINAAGGSIGVADPSSGIIGSHKTPKRPWNAMKHRTWAQKRGFNLKALMQRH